MFIGCLSEQFPVKSALLFMALANARRLVVQSKGVELSL